MVALSVCGCGAGQRLSNDDDSSSADDSSDDDATDDDDSADDDDSSDDDDSNNDDEVHGDDDTTTEPELLGDGSSQLTGTWTFHYWVDRSSQELGCEQVYEWTGVASFNLNALGNSCLECSGSIEVLNVVDRTESHPEGCNVADDLAGIDLGDRLTNPDPANPFRDFIFPQGLITRDYGLDASLQLTNDGSINYQTFAGQGPAGSFFSHVGYLEELEGRYFDSVNSGDGLSLLAAAPPGAPGWVPFWRYYGLLGESSLGAMSGHYFYSSLWAVSFGDGTSITSVTFSGELDAVFTPQGSAS
tara:strand:+ start:11076 stop:11978 length:903 start_codon:yes stop_codon:yes gene_type:complete